MCHLSSKSAFRRVQCGDKRVILNHNYMFLHWMTIISIKSQESLCDASTQISLPGQSYVVHQGTALRFVCEVTFICNKLVN